MKKKTYSLSLCSLLAAGVFLLGTTATGSAVAAGEDDCRPGIVWFPNSTKATGDAATGDVLAGKTFSGDAGTGVSGTMADNGSVIITPSSSYQPIAAGYHNGSGTVVGDADLIEDNIKSGTEIFGVTGTLSAGGSAAVPATGQTPTIPLDVSGIDGADGKLGIGVVWPNPRFTDNSNGTVTDNLTGLVWLKDVTCANTDMNWTNALAFAHALYDGWTGGGSGSDCGLSDNSTATQWRLPNVQELLSLIAWQYSGPALSNDAGTDKWGVGTSSFTTMPPGYFWSSSTAAGFTGAALIVHPATGYVTDAGKTAAFYLWPVRD